MKNFCSHIIIYSKRTIFIICVLNILFSCSENPKENTTSSFEDPILQDYESPSRKIGFLDTFGKMVIEAQYDEVRDFEQSRAAVNYQGRWGFIDPFGKWVVEPKYLGTWSFSEGLARVQSSESRLFGYIDLQGKSYIPPTYTDASDFKYGLARVKSGNYYGVINFDNVFILEPEHERIRIISSSEIAVKSHDEWYIKQLDSGNKDLGPFKAVYDSEFGLYRVKTPKNNILIINKEGKPVIQDELLDMIFTEKPGIYAVETATSSWQLVDSNNNRILNQDFDQLRPINAKRLAAKKNDKWAILDSQGNKITPFLFEQLYHFNDGYAPFMKDRLWGYVDTLGNIAAPAAYGLAWPFSEGKARVLTRQGVAVVDDSFRFVVAAGMGEVRDYSEHRAAVKTYDN